MYTSVKYINSVVITDRERDVEVWKNVKVYLKWSWNKSPFDINSLVFQLLVVWSRYCVCEMLIANPIDWLNAACLEYFIFSRSTVQKLENNMMNNVCQSCKIKSLTRTGKKCTLEWNSVVIKDRERDVQVWKHDKVYFKWGGNRTPFDINSVVFALRDVLNSFLIAIWCPFHIKSAFS
jgi:hypothetical protein